MQNYISRSNKMVGTSPRSPWSISATCFKAKRAGTSHSRIATSTGGWLANVEVLSITSPMLYNHDLLTHHHSESAHCKRMQCFHLSSALSLSTKLLFVFTSSLHSFITKNTRKEPTLCCCHELLVRVIIPFSVNSTSYENIYLGTSYIFHSAVLPSSTFYRSDS